MGVLDNQYADDLAPMVRWRLRFADGAKCGARKYNGIELSE